MTLSFWSTCFSFGCADRSVCERKCVWEPDRVRVASGRAEPSAGDSFMTMSENRNPPLLLLACLSFPWAEHGPDHCRTAQHRKGGREIISCTAANKWARAVWVNNRQEEHRVKWKQDKLRLSLEIQDCSFYLTLWSISGEPSSLKECRNVNKPKFDVMTY